MFMRFIIPMLFIWFLPVTSFAMLDCPHHLDSRPSLRIGMLTITSFSGVRWRGDEVRTFRKEDARDALTLLYFLAKHFNEIFAEEFLIKRLFPQRQSETMAAKKRFIKTLANRLRNSFQQMDTRFDLIKYAGEHGVSWSGLSLASAPINRVGNVHVNVNEVFWKGSPVPRFGPDALAKRRLLLSLLDDVTRYSSAEELTHEAWPELQTLTTEEQIAKVHSFFVEMHEDFQTVDPEFRSIEFDAEKGYAWAVVDRSRHIVTPQKRIARFKRYRFRGRELELNNSTRALLELLVGEAPNILGAEDLTRAFARGSLSEHSTLLKVRISQLRRQVGFRSIANVTNGGYAWAALDKPEPIDSESPETF